MLELERLVEVIPLPAYFFDTETLILLAANDPLARLLGYGKDELLAMTVADLRPESELPKLRKALQSAPPEGLVEWQYKTKQGTPVYVQIKYRNSTFVDPGGVKRSVRMVVVSKSDALPVQSAEALFG